MKPSIFTMVVALGIVMLAVSICSCTWGSTQQVNTVSKDNISITLITNKRVYDLGEKVMVTARVKNHSSQSTYGYAYFRDIGEINIRIQSTETPPSKSVQLLEDGKISLGAWSPAYNRGELAPGKSLVHETFWNQKLYSVESGGLIEAVPGEYLVVANPGLSGLGEPPPTAFLTIEIRQNR